MGILYLRTGIAGRSNADTPHPLSLSPLADSRGEGMFSVVGFTQGGGRPGPNPESGRPDPGLSSCHSYGVFSLARCARDWTDGAGQWRAFIESRLPTENCQVSLYHPSGFSKSRTARRCSRSWERRALNISYELLIGPLVQKRSPPPRRAG